MARELIWMMGSSLDLLLNAQEGKELRNSSMPRTSGRRKRTCWQFMVKHKPRKFSKRKSLNLLGIASYGIKAVRESSLATTAWHTYGTPSRSHSLHKLGLFDKFTSRYSIRHSTSYLAPVGSLAHCGVKIVSSSYMSITSLVLLGQ